MVWVLIRIASNRLAEAILISTHNIGFFEGRGDSNEHPQHRFFEDLTKIIFELSSNIIKYAPYFFCCILVNVFCYISENILTVGSLREVLSAKQQLKMVILNSKEDVFPLWMEKMNSLRKDKTLYDVCIKVGDNQITAHKSVLASASEYFNSYFVGPLKTEDAIAEVDLSTIALDFESADAVVDFLYTGMIDIHDENLEAILKLATFLLIYPLKELCIKYMEQSCDLNLYMLYYLLCVDYMVADAEDIMIRTVKPRFHDWFINKNSTLVLSPYHLQN